jgi:transcriptional regulator with XRE-family HTH domain
VTTYLHSNIKFLRKRYAVTQEGLAFQVNKGQSTIGNWETQVSEPNISELVTISNYFGVSLDYLVLVDLKHGNLITDEMVSYFKEKGNVNGNRNSNLKPVKTPVSYSKSAQFSEVAEPDETGLWVLQSLLRGMDGKLDSIRLLAENIDRKLPGK